MLAAGPFSKRTRYRSGYLADLASASLDRFRGKHMDTNGGHWHYDASWTPGVTRLLVDGVVRPANATRPSSCRPIRLGPHRVRACRVVPYEEGGGLSSGHIAYIWSRAAATFVISVHGYGNEPRARAMMVALIGKVIRESGEPRS